MRCNFNCIKWSMNGFCESRCLLQLVIAEVKVIFKLNLMEKGGFIVLVLPFFNNVNEMVTLGGSSDSFHTQVYDTKSSMKSSNPGGGRGWYSG